MNLEDMSKKELLELITLLHAEGGADPESLYTDRSQIIGGPEGDRIWHQCQKYRQPLIKFIYQKTK